MDQFIHLAIIGLVSMVFLIAIARLGRSGKLSFRYTVGWTVMGLVGLLSAFLLKFATPAARLVGTSPGTIFLALAVLVLVAVCVQLSVSVSGNQEHIRTLVEEIALLRNTVDTNEQSGSKIQERSQ